MAVDSGVVTEAAVMLDREASDSGVTIGLLLSSTAAGVPHAHKVAMKNASIVAHLRDTKPAR